jgi:molybdopterin-synthase adenylyltransferase
MSLSLNGSLHPRIKSIYPVYKLHEGLFRIGAQRGLTRQYRDPANQLWELVQLMDGLRSIQRITDEMRAKYPALTEENIHDGIRRLDVDGFLEDAQHSKYDDSESQLYRYSANVNYFSHYARLDTSREMIQDKLFNSKVALLGLGGGGSAIFQLLIGLGINHITAVDYDVVEQSNLNRQFLYRNRDIGKLKTTVAMEFAREINPNGHYQFVDKKIDGYVDLLPIIAGHDLVISTIDEPQFLAFRRVNKACVVAGIPCVFAGVQTTKGRVFSVRPGQSGCLDCLHLHYEKIDPLYAEQLKGFHDSDFQSPSIAFGPNIFAICAKIAEEAVRVLTGYLPPISFAHQYEIDFETGTWHELNSWARFSECPTCGTGETVDWPSLSYYRGEL